MIGEQIGAYRVVEKLAEGGMGAVYIARHDLMQREAVIKVLLPALSADQEMVRRFLNEARAATQIHHPGIVEIFDMGYLPSGQAFIVMERLRGDPLASRLRQGPLSVSQATALLRQLASALGAAHEAGIVHRDLKPDNLFLARDPSVKDPVVAGGERLKILDFGIAKLARGGGTLATVAGAVFGTPAYMSPEQCTSAGTVDHRSDIYAIGCILFEALCGRPPFGHGGIELIASHMRDAPPDPRTLSPTIPGELVTLLGRLLEKDPARRPQSCAEIAAAIDHPARTSDMLAPTMLPGASNRMSSAPHAVAVPTPMAAGQQYPATARTRSNKGLWLALAGVALIGGGGAAVFALGGDDKPPAASGAASTVAAAPGAASASAPASAPSPQAPPAPPIEAAPAPAEAAPVPAQAAPVPAEAAPAPAEAAPALGLSSKEIARVIKASTGQFRACYERELQRQPNLEGKVVLDLVIAADGLVTSSRTDAAKGTLTAAAVTDCIAGQGKRLKFPAKGLIVNVSYPFVFRAADAAPGPVADCDEVSCVINNYEGSCCKKYRKSPRTQPSGGSDLPEKLGKAEIQAGIGKIRGRVMACNDKYQVPGTVSVKLRIEAGGVVSTAQATGSFAGTPTGSCVESAVKGATFAKAQEAISVTYPFVFR